MKRIDIFISQSVESKTEAAVIVQTIAAKLKDQPNITVRAEYQDAEQIPTTTVP